MRSMDGVTTLMASNAKLDTVMILRTVQIALLVGQEESAIAMCHKTKQGTKTFLSKINQFGHIRKSTYMFVTYYF